MRSGHYKSKSAIQSFLSRGTRPTIKYIGVKMPNSPALAKPMAPVWSMTCVLLVPTGAMRRNSMIIREYFVTLSPNQLN